MFNIYLDKIRHSDDECSADFTSFSLLCTRSAEADVTGTVTATFKSFARWVYTSVSLCSTNTVPHFSAFLAFDQSAICSVPPTQTELNTVQWWCPSVQRVLQIPEQHEFCRDLISSQLHQTATQQRHPISPYSFQQTVHEVWQVWHREPENKKSTCNLSYKSVTGVSARKWSVTHFWSRLGTLEWPTYIRWF